MFVWCGVRTGERIRDHMFLSPAAPTLKLDRVCHDYLDVNVHVTKLAALLRNEPFVNFIKMAPITL